MSNGSGTLSFERDALDALFGALAGRGYTLVGPTVRGDAIVYDELHLSADLPIGWTDVQEGGCYQLERHAAPTLFGYTVPAHSWKGYLHPPALRLWSARRSEGGFALEGEPDGPPYAFIGARACELNAIRIQDRVFLGGAHSDEGYRRRREAAFVVAVNCTRAGNTCFCTSLGAGPACTSGFDLALTELCGDGEHRFVVEVGSPAGGEVMGEVPHRDATPHEIERAEREVRRAAAGMGRDLDTDGLKERLDAAVDHPFWDEVADRCLTCGNCTMVCPTCFCTTVEDTSDLQGAVAERVRLWDSCFTMDFSYLHGGPVRASAAARYRQWMTHKLASWIDQFGTPGCVGCGRCITWCPVGIDITAGVLALREPPPAEEDAHDRTAR